MIAYFDTSALVKTVIDEPGSQVAIEAWNGGDARATSMIAYVEARAALAMARRERRLTRATEARARLDDRWSAMHRIAVSDDVVHVAGDLADAHALRGFDSVHLATALQVSDPDRLIFVTWNRALAHAASRSGLSVAPALD